MPLPVRLAVVALAGAAAGVAFPPYGWTPLLPVAVAALALSTHAVRLRTGFGLGAVFGTVFLLVLMPWLQVIGADVWVLLSGFEGLFYGLLGLGTAAVSRLRGWPVWVAALWVGVELLRGTVPFGGFPWGRLAFATADTPLADLLPYVGTAGVSFAVALVGSLLAWAVTRVGRAPVPAFAAVAAAALLAVSGSALGAASAWLVPAAAAAEPVGEVRLATVQGNVPGQGMDAFAERRAVLDNHVAATQGLAERVASGGTPRPDLVLWPENSTDIDPFSDPTVYADIQDAVDAVGVPVLVGAMVSGEDPGDVLNQGIVWEPGAGPGERYAKTHPVPFGEYIPYRDLIARWFTRLDQIPRDMVPGTEPGLLTMAGVTLGDVICFEVAYDDLVRDVVRGGAELLVVQTNNATYMGTGQVEQQFAISRLRAQETQRYVAVAATNGVSGVVAPDGEVVQRAPVRTQAVLETAVPLLHGLTPGVRLGRGLELLLAAVGGLALATGVASSRRDRRRGTGRESGGGTGVAGAAAAAQTPANDPVGQR